MLIQFTVANYRSFKEPVTFSMLAAPITSKDKELDINNIFDSATGIKLLTSSAVYGANASGKSNLVKAMQFMRSFVLRSVKESQNEKISTEAFRLHTETIQKPSYFEIVFIMDEHRYRYGFEVTSRQVVSEWLYYVPTLREAKLFERKNGEFQLSPKFKKEGRNLLGQTRDDALFLSVVAQFNGPTALGISSWFRNFTILLGLDDVPAKQITLKMLKHQSMRANIVKLIHRFDLAIDDISTKKLPPFYSMEGDTDGLPDEFRGLLNEFKKVGTELEKNYDLDFTSTGIMTSHKIFDGQGKENGTELFDLETNESDGTRMLVALAGPLLLALVSGHTLLIDELDSRLHPALTRAIIGWFNNKTSNKRNAQLIFTTHDTNLLSKEIFRRDQIWFVEKKSHGESGLFSLVEYKVRNDADFQKGYIEGKYGAVPFVGDIANIMDLD